MEKKESPQGGSFFLGVRWDRSCGNWREACAMTKSTIYFFLAMLVAIAGVLGVPGSASAGVTPLSDEELRALVRLAEQGDIEATGRVWQEYALIREDSRNGKIWESRAIRAGDPSTMFYMAADWMRYGQENPQTSQKLILYQAAIDVLESGYRNRHLIAACDDRYYYIQRLRSARAALATARSGPAAWEQDANGGSASAAYHLANHYFWVQPDQTRRVQWERRASELGDPMFAGNIFERRPASEDIRDILLALGAAAEIAKLGDMWVQDAVTVELQNRLTRKQHFADHETDEFEGGPCKDF
jgi:hypothetical protein